MTKMEQLRKTFASCTDADLRRMIRHEQSLKALGFHPDELDIMKRGGNPAICDEIIALLQMELERRLITDQVIA